MNSEHTSTHEETIRVSAPVNEPELPAHEVMHARLDPADPDQAILANVPVLVDDVNFGDLVRLGPEDECGVRPIVEVVVPSGHLHFLAAAEPGDAGELVAELERTFPAYALRIEGASDSIVSVSVHPDVDADEVASTAAGWLVDPSDDPLEELPIGLPSRSAIGPLAGAV
jgi:hypothetical protein